MFSQYSMMPALQRAKSTLIKPDLINLERLNPIDTFYKCLIVHPITQDNKIHFAFMFLPENDISQYFVFKPVMNKKGETVSIVYELGVNADCELAAMALLHLLKSAHFQSHQPVIEMPGFQEILDQFEGVVRYYPDINLW